MVEVPRTSHDPFDDAQVEEVKVEDIGMNNV